MTPFQRFAFVPLVILVACTTCLFAQRHAGMPPPEVRLSTPVVTVPMDLSSGIPVVQVTINGKGPFPFVVDTGAAGSVISDILATELNLSSMGEVGVHSPMGGDPIPGKLVRMDSFQLGAATLSNFFAVSFDTSNVFRKPGAPRGILSANSFPGYLLTLNYPEQQIELRAGELPEPDNSEILDFDPSEPLVILPVQIASVQIDAVLDSGSSAGIMLPQKYAAQLPLAGELTPADTKHTIDAEVKHTQGTLKGLVKLGGFSVENPVLLFSDSDHNGNIGSKFLNRFVVTLDRKNHRVQLKESR